MSIQKQKVLRTVPSKWHLSAIHQNCIDILESKRALEYTILRVSQLHTMNSELRNSGRDTVSL